VVKSKIRDIRARTGIRVKTQGGWRSLALILGDICGLAVAWQVALKLNDKFSPLPKQLDWGEFAGLPALFWGFTGVIVCWFAVQHFYRHDQEKNYVRQAQTISNIYLGSLILSYFYNPTVNAPRSLFIPAWLGSVVLVIGIRLVLSLGLDQLQAGQKIATFIIAPEARLAELACITTTRANAQIVGMTASHQLPDIDILEAITRSGAKQVIAEDLPETELASYLYWQLRHLGITLRLVPSSLMWLHRRGRAEVFAGMPTIRIEPQLLGSWEYVAKRVLDVVGALVGLIVLSPLFVLVALAVQFTSPGGAFYSQERVGLRGQVFRMWKFRTMYQDADKRQQELEHQVAQNSLFKITNDPRVTKIGSFLRRTSIDELPQLFNVLLGDMSLVGPRPLPLRDVAQFAPWHHTRHVVIPGITGLWQVSGRSNLSNLDEVVQLDLFYIDYWSLNFDLQLIMETVRIIFFGKGAY
jgi:exopolysaccharide biosynthesis polyprenyl glycosylphosphotransferase